MNKREFKTKGLNVDCHIFNEKKKKIFPIKTESKCARTDKKYFIVGLNT